jgi:hypothetical protein
VAAEEVEGEIDAVLEQIDGNVLPEIGELE